MTEVGQDRMDILDCGRHDGLAASSILDAVVDVYRMTGDKKYLKFAKYIADRGASKLGNIYELAVAGTHPENLGNGKAYEMTSCFEGLIDLYHETGDSFYRDTALRYFEMVRDREIFVTGVGGLKDGSGELWYDGAFRQTRSDSGMLGETCVTTTWLHYCEHILSLEDNISAAAAIECSLYNGILGAMAPDATNWVHVNPTPLTGGGWKCPAVDQIGRWFQLGPFGGHDCCRAQGPEGLALASNLAYIPRDGGALITFYEPMETPRFRVEGKYPLEPEAVVRCTQRGAFALKLRMPAWIRKASLNGVALSASPDTWLELERDWSVGDEVHLEFDFSLKEISAPDGSPYIAVKCGPLVLAEDSRGWFPEALVRKEWRAHKLVDYASAGNLMCKTNTLTVWFTARPCAAPLASRQL